MLPTSSVASGLARSKQAREPPTAYLLCRVGLLGLQLHRPLLCHGAHHDLHLFSEEGGSGHRMLMALNARRTRRWNSSSQWDYLRHPVLFFPTHLLCQAIGLFLQLPVAVLQLLVHDVRSNARALRMAGSKVPGFGGRAKRSTIMCIYASVKQGNDQTTRQVPMARREEPYCAPAPPDAPSPPRGAALEPAHGVGGASK